MATTHPHPKTDGPGAFAPACDVLVVGGGINGAGIARDLAGRGWSVVLTEQDDLASHTSSCSTKLIHGGLRYLEYYEFSLVRKALQEREVLLRSAPHIMWPLSFVMPHHPQMRPAWMIRAGLFLYDHLARREILPGSRGVDLSSHPAGTPLKGQFTKGFAYSDGWVDDARLVVLNALDARDRGAQIHTRTRCTIARRTEKGWTATLRTSGGNERTLTARALVNAAGPWAASFLQGPARAASGEPLSTRTLRLIKGSHIVVPRCFEHEYAYIFQNPDKRIIFAIPYEERFTLIGTTDLELEGDPSAPQAGDDEIGYLCEQASRYFRRPVTPADVVWTYSGVRPLLDDAVDPSALTRDYLLECNADGGPLLTVWGGKITTFRKLAEEAAGEIGRMLGDERTSWTSTACLPGGDFGNWIGVTRRPDLDFARFCQAVRSRYPWIEAGLSHRLARAYGSRIERIIGEAKSAVDMGEEVAPGVFEAELQYLRTEEWARTGEDVLWRRSKRGLHLRETERQRVAGWMSSAGERRMVA